MTYKIIVDSCCDLNLNEKADGHFQVIPLTLKVGNKNVRDDESFNRLDFINLVENTAACPQSACPSPEEYKNAYCCDADMIFVVTLSEHLSGSYNSARVGLALYREEFGENKKIAVFSSDSASSGESLLALKIRELAEEGTGFDEIVEQIKDYKQNMGTYFVLETLDFLKKNGRLTGLQALIINALNIKPIMGSHKGKIIKLDQARGINRALQRMCEIIASKVKNPENKILAISHCNCRERAEAVKEKLMGMIKVKDIYMVETAGVSTLYAGNGGIVVAI